MRKLIAIILMLAICVAAIVVAAQAEQVPGDVNQSGSVNITDAVDLIAFIFDGRPIPRTEWVEVDTTVSVVWILDRPFPVAEYPIRVQKHFYVAGSDTTWLREVVIDEATYLHNRKAFIRTVEK